MATLGRIVGLCGVVRGRIIISRMIDAPGTFLRGVE